ncbi:hypothetical protein R1sor_010022 [Riccia sorocarpa]|uniref:Uncharacterized protein n=1 Tax=Riccia sorocarpa TaxID=122646 RepID=A0ABD3HYF9_9MARC
MTEEQLVSPLKKVNLQAPCVANEEEEDTDNTVAGEEGRLTKDNQKDEGTLGKEITSKRVDLNEQPRGEGQNIEEDENLPSEGSHPQHEDGERLEGHQHLPLEGNQNFSGQNSANRGAARRGRDD